MFALDNRGVVAAYINVDKVDINQCEGNESPFAGTHHCPSATTVSNDVICLALVIIVVQIHTLVTHNMISLNW